MTRHPEDTKLPFQGYKLIFDPSHSDDHVLVTEGGTEQTTAAVLDEAIAALKASPKLSALTRDPVLDKAARFNSEEFAASGAKRTAHVDSLGRRPSADGGLWCHAVHARGLDGVFGRVERQVRANHPSLKEDAIYYLVELPEGGGYHCRSVPESFAKFIAEHGQAVTIPELDQPGHECLVRVDRKTRKLSCGAAAIDYPLRLPFTGENVVWGAWSRKSASVAWSAGGCSIPGCRAEATA